MLYSASNTTLPKSTHANGCLRWSNSSTQDTTKCETRRQRKVVRDLLQPKRLLLKDEAFRHILPNNCNYALSMP